DVHRGRRRVDVLEHRREERVPADVDVRARRHRLLEVERKIGLAHYLADEALREDPLIAHAQSLRAHVRFGNGAGTPAGRVLSTEGSAVRFAAPLGGGSHIGGPEVGRESSRPCPTPPLTASSCPSRRSSSCSSPRPPRSPVIASSACATPVTRRRSTPSSGRV